jgi:type IX secretion system PorP/SprF family membrane protein
MLKRISIILTFFILFITAAKAQDPEYSQFYANPLYLNPALAGADFCKRAVLNYRNQWPGMSSSYISYNASYDQYIDKMHGGLGVLVNVDNAGNGTLRTTQASLLYSYRLQASSNLTVNMAMQVSFSQRALNYDLLKFGDQFDPQLGFVLPSHDKAPDNASIIYPDFDAGAVFGWKGVLHGGVAVHHMTQPNMAYYMNEENKLPMKYTGHFGVNINPNGEGMLFDPVFWIAPNILYQQQGKFHQFNTGLYVIRLPLVLGAWYRFNAENADAVIVLAGVEYKNLKFGYSYDITLSKLGNDTGGAHEISLSWHFDCISKLKNVYQFNAPGF